ncbi:hypothetical protein F5984_17200 [Rudanella paleaurantiibacter]|uniref:Uncharacterized protein n=1 Tax=Rudanella paleaurantiibacter TaxID=2614655 RepID=A0A7J5TXL4_9BACT|nr:hypothetical protein [Rudanella paleaurantiibacter]KAB7729360.1 hypothetical protein F5984_17200 [Rudanella paleaurantiibacter]
MDNLKVCLLLSATIRPTSVPFLKRTSALDRERDYVESVSKWIAHGLPIVFVENSGTTSENVKSELAKISNTEYLTYVSQNSSLGKSHGEIEIIEYAFKNSRIIQESDLIIKVTGRYYVENLMNILSDVIRQNAFVMGWMKHNLEFADSRLMIARKDFYREYFIPQGPKVSEIDGIYFEHIYARAIHSAMSFGLKWCFPISPPIFDGFSGTEDLRYKNDIFRRLKRNIILSLTKTLLKINY